MNKTLKIIILLLADAISLFIAWFVAIEALGLGTIGEIFATSYYLFLIELAVIYLFGLFFGTYSNIWRFAGFLEGLRLVATNVCLLSANIMISIFSTFGFSWVLIVTSIFFILSACIRYSYRVLEFILRQKDRQEHKTESKRIIVVGAGLAGATLIKEMITSEKLNMIPVCVLDDDKRKLGMEINGVKVVGVISDVEKIALEYKADEILVAIPSADRKTIKGILTECQKTNLKVSTLPGLFQLANGNVSIADVKEVDIKDLLGREQVKVNLDEIMGYIENQVVLVTGGGGSIGSELCRQIACHKPKQLIILDIYENNAYEIQQELLRKHADLNLLVLIGSVRDSKKINSLFEKYKPDIVFHAAAHKHVPLMETSPNEAVKNNVSGTLKVAEAAGKNGTKKFILISTDKAVNPTNIMGATKRICEMIIQTLNRKFDTEYVAVRFGNVLGSNGSVIPLFKKQIEEGGPVTVTHKDIVRYFMTIPEAVSLVLQAGAYAKGGEIFVLDMGEPVRIYDLAINLIKLSGLVPGKDIEVKITGLRPGEKLYEERLMEEEGLQKTANEMISIGRPLDIDEENLLNKLNELYVEAYNETDRMKELVHELVPTYKIDKR